MLGDAAKYTHTSRLSYDMHMMSYVPTAVRTRFVLVPVSNTSASTRYRLARTYQFILPPRRHVCAWSHSKNLGHHGCVRVLPYDYHHANQVRTSTRNLLDICTSCASLRRRAESWARVLPYEYHHASQARTSRNLLDICTSTLSTLSTHETYEHDIPAGTYSATCCAFFLNLIILLFVVVFCTKGLSLSICLGLPAAPRRTSYNTN